MPDAVVDERYPAGRFQRRTMPPDAAERRVLIDEIAALPEAMRAVLEPLTEPQLGLTYRDGGWTIRQVAHHVPDSHMNAYVRFKLALTEENPVIKTYEEALWAELADVRQAPIGVSLALLDALHHRWVLVLRSLGDADFAKTFRHPELGEMTLDNALVLYAWHGRHHLAHVEQALKRQ
jgi:hypothetical protein